jgi:hypothetical protein
LTDSHCAAISVSWLLKYRDATEAPWKNVLDLWFSNTILHRGAAFSSLSVRELTAHLNPKKSKRGDKFNLSYSWKSALIALKDNLQLAPIEASTSRQGVEGYPLWHNPLFNMPPELAQFKALREHFQINTLDNISDAKGTFFGRDTLYEYLTEDNGVTWHQDQDTITV